ncbi:uncharacterized protein MAM_01116 [Metarhizium album ARSEF 1941]|uniref:Uncharacterized protein n=1 Tax=Metarhizium album (strain ARSEF 1941) TaxID=1081103 RepID=A0A0B2X964_METAS|nr:uncharacterized protein MAM_01116 [Metarhizium album ARSEF 1941]KHO02115.1 hypothetical protein MAM_01116 [Metarhizium album ARSEF 1941]
MDEIRVLLVRDVLKRRFIRRLQHPRRVPGLLLAAILPNKGASQEQEEREFYTVGHEEGANTQPVRRRLVRPVEEGAGNVANAGAEPNHARDNHLLGLAARV